MRNIIFLLTILVLSMALVSPVQGATRAEDRLQSYEKHLELKENSIFKKLDWRNVGPFFPGGRIDDIEGYENNPNKYLLATASGGLWVTENNGTTWLPIFENESSITIGDIAVSQTDEKLIWVGTGEQNSSRSSYAGTGIFKSTNGGKSWQNMGLTESHHIARVIVLPGNNDTVFVAVLGHLYSENKERGLYKTTDGGKTWKKNLYVDTKTGVIDVAINPKNPDILYAATWQKVRHAWNLEESGVGSAIYKSTDGGESWEKCVTGFPQNKYTGRIGLAIYPQNPDIIYASLDNQEPRPEKKEKKKSGDANENLFQTTIKGGEVYRSSDAGKSWSKTNKAYLDELFYTYGYYFGQIRVAPDNENVLYLLGVPLLKSTDGGQTFKNISRFGGSDVKQSLHGDIQALWINPKNANHILVGDDGGLFITYDAGNSWRAVRNISLGQCYSIAYDNKTPYNVYTGLQDNGVNVGSSQFTYGNHFSPWKRILGGDGAFVQPETGEADTVFAAFQFGYIFRIDLKNNQRKYIKPTSEEEGNPYRFNWITPFFVSPHNHLTLYMGGNKVLKSLNRGDKWIEISPDLTEQKNTGGDVPYATITALDESPLSPELLYAGTDDGNVRVKKSNTALWEKINKGLPKKWVTRLIASKYKKERVYVTLTGYRDDDFETYVFCSEDYGKNWASIKGNLPGEPVNVIREDPENADILYLGSDLGVYISLDRGLNWNSLKSNLPTNAVYDLRIHPRDKELMIGTHGRGVYILPVKNIQLMTAELLKKEVHLFEQAPVRLTTSPFDVQGNAKIQYYSAAGGDFKLIIKNKDGKIVKRADIKDKNGIGIYEWDLIGDETKKIAEKGEYTLILKKGKKKSRSKLKLN
ncbi:MAG: glycosyl hydrolase [bacterium]|nr:glycosyl hydrolase [bacterium]